MIIIMMDMKPFKWKQNSNNKERIIVTECQILQLMTWCCDNWRTMEQQHVYRAVSTNDTVLPQSAYT